MTTMRVLAGCGAFGCGIVLLFWMSWAFEHLSGWTAFPIGLSVFAVIYAVGALLVMASAGVLGGRK